MVARPEPVSRNLVVFELRRFPGQAHECAISIGCQGARFCPHAQRLGSCDRPHAGCFARELPTARWLGYDSRGVAPLHERRDADREIGRSMRILVTNDDGIHAPGLAVAEGIARALCNDVWVGAPETEQSGASHSLTLAVPLRLRKINSLRFAVTGTPTD